MFLHIQLPQDHNQDQSRNDLKAYEEKRKYILRRGILDVSDCFSRCLDKIRRFVAGKGHREIQDAAGDTDGYRSNDRVDRGCQTVAAESAFIFDMIQNIGKHGGKNIRARQSADVLDWPISTITMFLGKR